MHWLKNKNTPQPANPFFIPDEVLVITNYGVYLEQYAPSLREIATKVPMGRINEYLSYTGRVTNYSGVWGVDGAFDPFLFPNPESIKVSSIKLFAMVVTYPKVVARMVGRRISMGKNNMARGLKSIWVIALIVITLFIILMLVVTIVGAKDNPDPGLEEVLPMVEEQVVIPQEGGAVQTPSNLTVPYKPPAVTPPKPSSKATKTSDDLPKGVLIDGE